jgi:hypothetical protein
MAHAPPGSRLLCMLPPVHPQSNQCACTTPRMHKPPVLPRQQWACCAHASAWHQAPQTSCAREDPGRAPWPPRPPLGRTGVLHQQAPTHSQHAQMKAWRHAQMKAWRHAQGCTHAGTHAWRWAHLGGGIGFWFSLLQDLRRLNLGAPRECTWKALG